MCKRGEKVPEQDPALEIPDRSHKRLNSIHSFLDDFKEKARAGASIQIPVTLLEAH